MTKVKICGITNLEDALVAVEAGADMLGFIFYEPSPRYVQPEVVREIVSVVSDQLSVISEQSVVTPHASRIKPVGPPAAHHITFVGVFVNEPLDKVAHILGYCGLNAAQLHGEEPLEFVAHLQGRAFKALRPQSAEEAEALIKKYKMKDEGRGVKDEGRRMNPLTGAGDERNTDVTRPHQPSNLPTFQPSTPPPLYPANLPTLLLDAYHPTLYGGTGHVTDWSMAANIARRFSLLLAGSLTPENVAEAVQVVQPWGVDVSSGVEQEKGKKDHGKVRAFVEAVKFKT
jgi:phosphoribosylanthranilate isomerase